jgi:hypothetical protein
MTFSKVAIGKEAELKASHFYSKKAMYCKPLISGMVKEKSISFSRMERSWFL